MVSCVADVKGVGDLVHENNAIKTTMNVDKIYIDKFLSGKLLVFGFNLFAYLCIGQHLYMEDNYLSPNPSIGSKIEKQILPFY